uniref:Uncharacterized protein n=1 Tax=Salix viminalis TaxID=40686 RepID=A0A6N2K507_SALVM
MIRKSKWQRYARRGLTWQKFCFCPTLLLWFFSSLPASLFTLLFSQKVHLLMWLSVLLVLVASSSALIGKGPGNKN